jgi:hypothetical protein
MYKDHSVSPQHENKNVQSPDTNYSKRENRSNLNILVSLKDESDNEKNQTRRNRDTETTSKDIASTEEMIENKTYKL